MAHDPSLGFADYFSAAADATAMEEGAPELYGLHADMEFLAMRGGLAAVPAAAHGHGHSKAVLLDDDGGSTNAATMQFLSAGGHHQQQPSQAPLSLSLCRPDGAGGVGVTLHEHLGGSSRHHQQQPPPAAWMEHDYSAATQGTQHAAAAWHLRSSRFLLPAQQLLQEFCSLPVESAAKNKGAKQASTAKPPSQQQQQQEDGGGGEGSSSSTSWAPSPQIQAMDALELQRFKDKLYIMLEEVSDRSIMERAMRGRAWQLDHIISVG